MPNKIKCRECKYLVVSRINRRKAMCDCNHPGIPELVSSVQGARLRSYSNNARIGYTEDYSDVPAIKTRPKWCPIKAMEVSQ